MPIRSAEPPNLTAIQRLLSTCGLPHGDLTPSHLEHFLVDVDADGLRGVVGVELYGDVALLRSLAVSTTHRDEGIGARLTSKIERYARRHDAHEMYLLTTSASEFFGRRGYSPIDRTELPESIRQTEEASRLCPSSATCMKKHLDAESPD